MKNDAFLSQAGAFEAASAGVKDPSRLQELVQRFPLVADVLVKAGGDQAAGTAALTRAVTDAMGKVFGNTFLVAAFLVLLTLIPALLLPRKIEVVADGEAPQDEAAPVLLH